MNAIITLTLISTTNFHDQEILCISTLRKPVFHGNLQDIKWANYFIQCIERTFNTLCVQRDYFSTIQPTLKAIFYATLTMLKISDPTLFARMLNLSVVFFPLFINFCTPCYRILAYMKHPIPTNIHYDPKRTNDPYGKIS